MTRLKPIPRLLRFGKSIEHFMLGSEYANRGIQDFCNDLLAEEAEKTAKSMKKMYSGKGLSEPELIARTIAKSVTVRKPKTRYLVGFGAKPAVTIKNILGDRGFDHLSSRVL